MAQRRRVRIRKRKITPLKRSAQELAADYVVSHFSGVVKSSDDFNYTAICPAHADQCPSLSIGITDKAKVLLNCHAGCSFREIVEAAGLDLFRGVPIVDVYEYRDADGTLLYQVCRTADKQFPGRLPDGSWGYPKASVLYRLPELLQALEDADE